MINREIMEKMREKIAVSTIYRKIDKIRQKTHNSISKNAAACILAAELGIDVQKILKNSDAELEEFRQSLKMLGLENQQNAKSQRAAKTTSNDDKRKASDERTPYDYSLSKFGLDNDLVKNCKMQKPYRMAVKEAALALEVRIRDKLNLNSQYFGIKLIDKANNMGIFDRPLQDEKCGLYFTYAGAVKWIRNPSAHQQTKYTKEEAIKLILYFDYLIKLFDKLVAKRHSQTQ